MLDQCKKGHHNLIEIYEDGQWDGDNIVRWCQICGAVVVDFDYDNRTKTGYVMAMKLPKLFKQEENDET